MWIKNFRRSHYLCSTMWELWTKRGWRPVQQAPKCKSRSHYHMTYQWFWSCGTTLYMVTLAMTQPKKLSILAMALYKIVMSSNCRLFNIFLILSLPWRIPRCLGNIVDLGNIGVMQNITRIPPVESGISGSVTPPEPIITKNKLWCRQVSNDVSIGNIRLIDVLGLWYVWYIMLLDRPESGYIKNHI